MEAVIFTGGKQYLVSEGDVLEVEKIDTPAGKKVTLDDILLVSDGKDTKIGTPFVKKAKVKAEVIEHKKGEKLIVFKYNPKKNFKKKKGHRQNLTVLKILEIIPS